MWNNMDSTWNPCEIRGQGKDLIYLARQVTCRYLQNSGMPAQIWQDPWEQVDLNPQVCDLQVVSGR